MNNRKPKKCIYRQLNMYPYKRKQALREVPRIEHPTSKFRHSIYTKALTLTDLYRVKRTYLHI